MNINSNLKLHQTILDAQALKKIPIAKEHLATQAAFGSAMILFTSISYIANRFIQNLAENRFIQNLADQQTRGGIKGYVKWYDSHTQLGPWDFKTETIELAFIITTVVSGVMALFMFTAMLVTYALHSDLKKEGLHLLRSVEGISTRLPVNIENTDQAQLVSEIFRCSKPLLEDYSRKSYLANHPFLQAVDTLHALERGEDGYLPAARATLVKYDEWQTALVDAQRQKLGLKVAVTSPLEMIP